MYRVLAILKVIDFDALTEFETKASKLMSRYGGRIVKAFETYRNDDGAGEEIHLIEFQNEKCFNDYRSDNWHKENRKLRELAISETKTILDPKEKAYTK